MSDTPPPIQRSGPMDFYTRIVPLTVEDHGGWGLDPAQRNQGFCRDAVFIPLMTGEFISAALDYPIIFMGDQHQPMAVVGLDGIGNLFVDNDVWDAKAYVPGFVRRHPFLLASQPASPDKMAICIDEGVAALHADGAGQRLFDDAGKPAPILAEAVALLEYFEGLRRHSEIIVKLLLKHELITTRTLKSEASDAPAATFESVSEERLAALGPAVLAELRDAQALGPIYAQLISLQNWPRLVQRAHARLAARGA